MTEFLYMGGYGAYVWSAYAVTLVVLLLNIVSAARALAIARRRTRERVRRAEPPR